MPAHRHAEVGGGHGWGVVDAVADQEYLLTACLQLFDLLDLAGGQQPGPDVDDADLPRQVAGGAGVVTGQQHRGRAGQRGHSDHGGGGVPPGPVGQAPRTPAGAPSSSTTAAVWPSACSWATVVPTSASSPRPW